MNGHVRQRKGKDGKPTSWAYVIELERAPNGKRQQRWKSGFTTRRAAERALREELAAREQGTFQEPCALTVAQHFEQWLAYKGQTRTPNTFQTYASLTRRHLIPAFGKLKLVELRGRQIDAWFAQTEVGPATREMCWRVLCIALRQAVRWDYLPRNPCDQATRPERPAAQTEGQERRTLTDAERARVVTEIPGWLRLAVIVAVGTGMRRGEVCGLRWQDVDFDARLIHVRQQVTRGVAELQQPGAPRLRLGPVKTKKSAAPIQVGDALLGELAEHRREQLRDRIRWGGEYEDNGLVFAMPQGGLRDPQSLTDAWRQAAKDLGLPLRFHDLRHDHATVLIEAGASLPAVSRRLRHADPHVTARIYAHVSAKMAERTADLANDVLGAALKGPLLPDPQQGAADARGER
ncbi:MAG: tyrosine-type recombinase/integrase [Actinomycetota bacterium]